MDSVDDHAAAVADLLAPVTARLRQCAPERLSIDDPGLAGRVCAEPIHAGLALPPFDNAQMDGYAVRAADLRGATEGAAVQLPIGVTTAAGDAPVDHQPGTASPVMTGAVIPCGADAVVAVEATVPPHFPALSRASEDVRPAQIGFTGEVEAGTFVRPEGSDQPAGALIADAGVHLTPALIGSLAAAGVTEVPVVPRMRILLCTTGDELSPEAEEAEEAEGDRPLAPGRIHDANGPMLSSLLHTAGADVLRLHTQDRPEALLHAVAQHAVPAGDGEVDLVVTVGGISAGAYEVVREAFADRGAQFGSVAVQPGGPQGLGTLRLPGAQIALPVLCFPGNPVSALLSAVLFLVPALRDLAGLDGLDARGDGVWRRLAADTDSPEHKLQLRRGVIEPDGAVRLLPPSSHLLHDLAVAEVIAEIPTGVSFAAAGTDIYTWRIHD